MLTDIQRLAIQKAISDATPASPGVHHVDFTVRIKGSINKGDSYQQRIVAKSDPWAILALVLERQNQTTADYIAGLVEEAAIRGTTVDGSRVKEYADAAIQRIKETTWQTCSGKTTAALTVDLIA